jgi:hypothetical protein
MTIRISAYSNLKVTFSLIDIRMSFKIEYSAMLQTITKKDSIENTSKNKSANVVIDVKIKLKIIQIPIFSKIVKCINLDIILYIEIPGTKKIMKYDAMI